MRGRWGHSSARSSRRTGGVSGSRVPPRLEGAVRAPGRRSFSLSQRPNNNVHLCALSARWPPRGVRAAMSNMLDLELNGTGAPHISADLDVHETSRSGTAFDALAL